MLCTIWYHLYQFYSFKFYNFKTVKNAHEACNFTKINIIPRDFFTFFKLYKWYQIAQSNIICRVPQGSVLFLILRKLSIAYIENLAWVITNVTKLNKIPLLQKRSVCVVFNEDCRSKENFALSHTRLLLREVWNIFQRNIYQYLNFMHKFNSNQIPNISYDITIKLQHEYPTKFWSNSFYTKKYLLKCTKFSISLCG